MPLRRPRTAAGFPDMGARVQAIFQRHGFAQAAVVASNTATSDAPSLVVKRNRPRRMAAQASGLSCCSRVGKSSLTVGWMCMAREITV